jgi:uncharacterized protein YndB with AHSA1/START domain
VKITIEANVQAPVEAVWKAWTTPSDIVQWNAASDDWHTTKAAVDLRVGGAFSSRMEAKDGSMGFDFAGTYTKVVENELLECSFGDRSLRVEFIPSSSGVTVRETFDAEDTHSIEQQRQGWQAILSKFARHVEGKRNEREFVVTRTLNAPPRIVFEAWSKAELFQRWWVPKSFGLTLLSCELDVRVGGVYRLVFPAPAGQEPMAFHGRYLEVTPPSRLVWTNEEAGGNGQVTTVTLEESAGKTLLVMRDLYPSKEALDEAIGSGSTCGMDETLNQLDELVATLGESVGRS